MEETSMVVAKDFGSDISNSSSAVFCSMLCDTPESKKMLYNCVSDPQHRISDEINSVINVKDVYIETVGCSRPDGTTEICPRVVLIDTKGEGHQCVSFGVYNALKKIFALMGHPSTWEKPLEILVKQVTRGEKKMLNLALK